ncbi:hypothetical protein ACGYLO_12740 [Sulfitobacter sp. 1A13353]|uniref:hypothetical protein n=1 Tax=Sulfitobacter sp. 1A13353 TaxID=3368568 RepID=UPI003745244F
MMARDIRFTWAFVCALGASGVGGPALAGDLRSSPEIAGCDYMFTGPVEEGDAQRIEETIPARYDGSRLCLDSPGGNFVEGLRMFHAIWNKDSVVTYVRSGDACYSACAIAFLGGSHVMGTGAIRFRKAVIEPGAHLGFHAPRLVLEEGSDHTSKEVEDAYAWALKGASYLFDLTQIVEHGTRGMTSFLFSRTLATPPEDMYEIDTIGKASLSQVDVAHVPLPKITWGAMRNVCDTGYVMVSDRFSGLDSAEKAFGTFTDQGFDGSGNPISLEDRVWSWTTGNFSYFAIRGYHAAHVNEKFCMVSMSHYAWDRENALPLEQKDPSSAFQVTFWNAAHVPIDRSFAGYVENNTRADHVVSVPWFALWDPNTPLTKFAAGADN